MQEETIERPVWIVCFRWVFVIFLAVSLYIIFPDKTQPRTPGQWEPEVYLIPPSQYKPRKCSAIAECDVSKYTAIATRLSSLANERGFTLLTAQHAGEPACLIVTSLLSKTGEFQALFNPKLISTEGGQYVQEESILCRRAKQRRRVVTRIRFQYINVTEAKTNEAQCTSAECASQLYTAFQVLNGSYACS